MHKDVFVFKEEHERRGQVIVDKFMNDNIGNNYSGVIGICGVSGCGKSEIAWWVARKLYKIGISSHVINLDRYYKVPAVNRSSWRKKNRYVGHEEMDWVRINKEIKDFGNNDIKVLILEGLYAGYADCTSFFIDEGLESTEDFRFLRGKENEKDDWRKYVVGEEYADILSGMRHYDYRI